MSSVFVSPSDYEASVKVDGTPTSPPCSRLVRRHGHLNVAQLGLNPWVPQDLYHRVLDLTWYKLLGLCLAVYLGLNVCFATLYWAVDGVVDANKMALPKWLVAFYFSVHTQESIGYGSLSPGNFAANLITGLQCWISGLAYAILTGLTFAKISRPSRIKRNIIFSNKAVVSGTPGTTRQHLGFRVANIRSSALCDPLFNLLLFYYDPHSGTEQFVLQELNYVINQQAGRIKNIEMSNPYLGLPWHVQHNIDHTSPLFGKTKEGLREMRAEIIAIVDGTDEVCSDNLQAQWSYTVDDIVWDADFCPMISVAQRQLVAKKLGPKQRQRARLNASVVNIPQLLQIGTPRGADSEQQPLLEDGVTTYTDSEEKTDDGVVLVDYAKFNSLVLRHPG